MLKILQIFLLSAGLLTGGIQVFAQNSPNKVVRGTVTDSEGIPLAGTSVSVKGSASGTLTDADGKYTVRVSENTTVLVFTFLGMQTQERIVGNQQIINVTLKPVDQQLEDVVVIGYGTVKKADLTGAVQSLSYQDLNRENPGNILSAMQGKLAGVNVTQNDGAPGAGLSIKIRGANSFLGGTEPLYVIDGVPFNASNSDATPQSIGEDEKQTNNVMSFLDPNDIESIDVLKDASATAIYGSRGANGVVLITTRKGKLGKDKVELSVNVGTANVSKTIRVLTPYEYAQFQNLSYETANKYDGTSYNLRYPDLSLYENVHTNWQDQIFRRGVTQQYNVNISGATDAGNHRISFNYLNQDGIINNSDYRRLGLSLNLNRNLGKIFKVGTSTSVSNNITNGVKTGTDKSDAASAGVIRSATSFPATITEIEQYSDSGDSYFITNPVIYTNDVLNRVNSYNIFSSNYVEAAILKSLKFRQNVGINYGSGNRDQYYPRTVYEGFASKGWGLKSDNQYSSIVSESILTFDKTVRKHSFNVVGASTYESSHSQWKRAEGKTFPNDLLQNENLESAEQVMPIKGAKSASTLISFLGRLNYAFDDRYLFTFSYRADGSSKFGDNNKWAGFPSAAFAWKINKEPFLSDSKTIDDLALRLSYGQTGNQGIGAYSSLSKLTVYNYPFDGNLQSGLADDFYSGPANSELKWETTTSYNLGLDVSVLKSRVNLHVDLYKKQTDDLLQYVTTPSSTGFERQLRNSGSIENKGLEIAIDGRVLSRGNFEWKSAFNIAFNRNKILDLGGPTEQYATNISTGDQPFIQTIGHPIGAIYGYVEDGYYDNEAEVRNSLLYTNQGDEIIRRTIGEIKYKDFDGDPTALSTSDRTFIGDVNPKYTFGFTNNFRYKSFDLSVFINGVQGNDIINMNTRFNANIGTQKNVPKAMLDGSWKDGQDNSNATWPKAMRQFWRTIYFSRRFVEDGSFVRIKNLALGYTLPKHLIKGISSAKITFGVSNLYTFTNYSGYDPEMNSYGTNPALFGVDLGGYPNSRTYNLSIRCGF
ncbi:TonB-dependent receptor (plasmid) [Pedobacter sp. BS3]|uniref:SusC/RagA family TonB-linked outer membrane protein n=1 Tax=Pedobacter sp. BS3 TaxID=2567937 RepID=UPI0011EDDBD0|nr:TonB-dependent receptor [Pedobacter sp. BS3]TZF86027.1 TonB-dependent receptor [Pedobacter sp. BS3]